MNSSDILNSKIYNVKRGFTFYLNNKKYTFFDLIFITDRIHTLSSRYRIKKRVYVLLNDDKNDFSILDSEYVKTYIKGNYLKSYSKFNISKKKFFDKLIEKYGNDYAVTIFEKNIETNLNDYIEKSLFYKNKILIFDNKVFMGTNSDLLKNIEISRYYKLYKLKNKIQ